MDEAAFLTVANATLERIGLALDAALETSNASFDWTLDAGVLTITGSETSVVVRQDVGARAIVLDAGGRRSAFQPEDARWVDERGNALGDALVRALRGEARISLRRVPELPAA